MHFVAYNSTTADGSTAWADVPAVSDAVLGLRNNHLVPTKDLALMAAAAQGTNLTNARISTPTTIVSPEHIRPINTLAVAGIFPSNPAYVPLMQNPPRMRGAEEIVVELRNAASAAVTVGLWLSSQFEPAPAGEAFWLRFTMQTPPPTNPGTGVWSAISVVWEKTSLPAGRYAILGMDGWTNAVDVAARFPVCARLVIPGQVERPGTILLTTPADLTPLFVRDNSLGVWGYFDALLPPSIEILCRTGGAMTGFEGNIKVVRVS